MRTERLTTVEEESRHTNHLGEDLTTQSASRQREVTSIQDASRITKAEVSSSVEGYPDVWSATHLIYSFQISEPGNTFRDEYRISPADCCTIWNLGFECSPRTCKRWHVCCFASCRTTFHTEHRAIQHSQQPDCASHAERLLGMNVLFPQALNFDDRSSVLDTQEACSRYGTKPPSQR